MINYNNNISITIAEYDTISLDHVINYFNEHYYFVQDVLSDSDFYCFDFYPGNIESERAAYKKAAEKYNSLVPEAECIPLF